MIVDRAIYRDGRCIAQPRGLPGMGEACGVAWVALYRPIAHEFAAVVRELDLPERFVEDAVHPHQRPKLERYGEMLFCVLRAARYLDDAETVEFSELHVCRGPALRRHGPSRRGARICQGSAGPSNRAPSSCAARRWQSARIPRSPLGG